MLNELISVVATFPFLNMDNTEQLEKRETAVTAQPQGITDSCVSAGRRPDTNRALLTCPRACEGHTSVPYL